MSNHVMRAVGMVIREEKDFSVVFLTGVKKAAILWRKNYERTFSLGTVFECHYRPIESRTETLFVPFEICGPPPIVREDENDVKIIGNRCLALFSFNLSAPVKEFKWWSKLSSQFVLESKHAGYIFMDATVMDKTGKRQSPDVIVQYEDKPNGTQMVGWCEFTRNCVPVACLDEHRGEDTQTQAEEPAWVWTLKEIVSTAQEYHDYEEGTKKANLGSESREVEQEDEMARLKRLAKAESENQQRYEAQSGPQQQYQQYPQNQGPYYPSQGQSSSSQYHQGQYPNHQQQQYFQSSSAASSSSQYNPNPYQNNGRGPQSGMDGLSGGMSNMSMGGSSRGPQGYGALSAPQGFNRDRQNFAGPSHQQYPQQDQWRSSSSRAPSQYQKNYAPSNASSSRSTINDAYRAKKEALRREADEADYRQILEHMSRCERSLGVFWRDYELRRHMKVVCFDAFVDVEKFLDEFPKQTRNGDAKMRR